MDEKAYLEKISIIEKERDDAINNMVKAAEYGNQLLEEQKSLKEKLANFEDLSDEFENLKQQHHVLELKLDLKNKIENNLQLELQTLREESNAAVSSSQKLAEVESDFQGREFQYKQKLEAYESEMTVFKTAEKQYVEKIAELEERVENFLNKTLNGSLHNSKNFDYSLELENVKSELSSECENLKLQIDEMKRRSIIQSDEIMNLQNENKKLLFELSEKDNIIEDYKNQKMSLQEEIENVKGELEILNADKMSTGKKGNSMFGEVEDRRKLVEKQYALIKAKYESQGVELREKQKHVHKLKLQNLSLLALSSTKNDDLVKQLSDQLFAVEENNKCIKNQLQFLSSSDEDNTESHKVNVDQCTSQKMLQSRINQLKIELRKQVLQTLFYEDKTIALTRKFVDKEFVINKLTSDNSKLKMQLEERSYKHLSDENGSLNKLPELKKENFTKQELVMFPKRKESDQNKFAVKENIISSKGHPLEEVRENKDTEAALESNKVIDEPPRKAVKTSEVVCIVDDEGKISYDSIKESSEKPKPIIKKRKANQKIIDGTNPENYFFQF